MVVIQTSRIAIGVGKDFKIIIYNVILNQSVFRTEPEYTGNGWGFIYIANGSWVGVFACIGLVLKWGDFIIFEV